MGWAMFEGSATKYRLKCQVEFSPSRLSACKECSNRNAVSRGNHENIYYEFLILFFSCWDVRRYGTNVCGWLLRNTR